MVLMFKMLIVNKFDGRMFFWESGSRGRLKDRKSEKSGSREGRKKKIPGIIC
jgi:hypothetical protein